MVQYCSYGGNWPLPWMGEGRGWGRYCILFLYATATMPPSIKMVPMICNVFISIYG